MRSQIAWTWLGCGSVALSLAACSPSNGSAGSNGSGGSAGSLAEGNAGASAAGKGGGASGGTGTEAGSSAGGSAGVSAGQLIGAPGGTVMQNGVTLVVPANAITTATPISVSAASAPAGFAMASLAFQFGPSGTTFAEPVAVTIPLTSSAPGAHLFWSNPSGGFDDIGGTVSGLSVTGNVSHFSLGFAAYPSNAGGSAGTGGSAGASGASSSGGASGSAGTTSSGGASGSAGSGGASGASGASSGSAGAGGASSGGSGGSSGASLCTATPLNLPGVKVTSFADAGAAPDSATYTGGTITTGNYYETGDAHYGSDAYSGPLQAVYMIDAAAQTIRIGERTSGGTYYIGMTYTQSDVHTLHATVACNTSPTSMTTLDYDYTLLNGVLTMSVAGSSDVMTLGAP
ncbi:MAG TPA: hypothetical protein VK745_08540 [Polyangiaceae bacterium]|jgi:hypothetical protein|nr:hypothetical protein [Polyangiaceae bacterium]